NINHLGPADIEEVRGLYKEMRIDPVDREEQRKQETENDGSDVSETNDTDGEDAEEVVSTDEQDELDTPEGTEDTDGTDSQDGELSEHCEQELIEEEPLPEPPQGQRTISGFKQMSHGQMMCKKCLETWFKVP